MFLLKWNMGNGKSYKITCHELFSSRDNILIKIWSRIKIGQLIDHYRPFQALSLDVCLGAVAGGIYASSVIDYSPPIAYFVILFLAVFFIYTLDHLIDARRIGKKTTRFRYQFHNQHFVFISFFTFVSGFLALFAALYYLSAAIIWGGLLLFVGVVIHLILAQYTRLPFMKEFSVAFYYTTGIWLVPLVEGKALNVTVWAYFALFYLSVFVSLALFSFFEIKEDRKDGSNSIAVFLGEQKSKWLIRVLLVICLVLLFYTWYLAEESQKYIVGPAIVLFVHFFMFFFPGFFNKNEIYRIVGDGVFLVYAYIFFFF